MVQQQNWWETTDVAGVAGEDGVDPAVTLDELNSLLNSPPTETQAQKDAPVAAPADDPWALTDAKMDAAKASIYAEVPAVMNDGNGFFRFAGELIDLAGRPIDTAFDALDYVAHVPERVIGLAIWNEYDMGTRWQLGGLTWEMLSPWGDVEKDDVIRRIAAGEDMDKIIEENEGGFFDMAMTFLTDPMNIFGIPGLGIAAKALPAGGGAQKFLQAVNRGVTAETIDRLTKAGTIVRTDPQMPLVSQSAIDDLLMAQGRVTTALKELDAAPSPSITRVLDDGTPYSVDVISERNRLEDELADLTAVKSAMETALATGQTFEEAAATVGQPLATQPSLLARIMRRSGLNVLESERQNAKFHETVDAFRRDTGTGWVKNAHNWAAKPMGWTKWTVLTPEAKRAEVAETLSAAWYSSGASMKRLEDADELVRAIIGVDLQSKVLQNNPFWRIKAQYSTTFLPDTIANMIGINKVNPPPALIGMLALSEELRATKKDASFFRSLTGENRDLFRNNRPAWEAIWNDDMMRLALGSDSRMGGATGAIDHMFGIGGAFRYDENDMLLGLDELELTVGQKAFEVAEAMQAQAKGVFSVLFMNTPSFMMKNWVGNPIRAIGTSGWEVFRGNPAKVGEELGLGVGGQNLVKIMALDLGRAPELTLKQAGTKSKHWWQNDWIVRPFIKLGSDKFMGDIPVMERIAGTETLRTWDTSWRMGKILPQLDTTGFSDDAAKTVVQLLESARNPQKIGDIREQLRNGSVGLDPAFYLVDKWLDAEGITEPGRRAIMFDLIDQGKRSAIREAYRTGTPQDMRRAMDGMKTSIAEEVQKFAPTHVKHKALSGMGNRRVYYQNVIGRTMQEMTAAIKRVDGMSPNVDVSYIDEVMQPFTKLQQKKLKTLYEALDKGDLAPGKRATKLREYDRWHDTEWRKVEELVHDHFATRPEVQRWWSQAMEQRKAAEAQVRQKRNATWDTIRTRGLSLEDDEAKALLDNLDAFRDGLYTRQVDDMLAITGLKRYPHERTTSAVDEAYNIEKGILKLQDDWTDAITKMQAHVDDLFVDSAGVMQPRKVVLTDDEVKRVEQYLELNDVEGLARETQAAALQVGANMARHALLGYERRYGIDDILKFAMPWGFWPQRMSHRYIKAAMSRPGAAASMAVLIQGNRDMNEGLPARLRGKMKVPLPFMPDWMGDGIYFDPISMAFPIKTGLDRADVDEDSFAGELLGNLGNIGMSPAPWITTPLQLAGVFGERERHIRYLAQGMPGLLPGTAAQKAIWGFLTGDPAEDWQDAAPPEALEKIMLGGAFPEPLLRDILGIPPGDPWDAYRIGRMLANLTGTGEVTPEEALKAMRARTGPVWDKANERAETEAGIRDLTSWGLGMGGTIYPKGEEIQNGLQMIFRAAQEADRKDPSAQDAHIQAFFDAFPEFEVRQAQRAWYRGQQEMDSELDTKLFYIDMAKIEEQFNPEIAKLEKIKASLPKALRGNVNEMLSGLYSEKDSRMNTLDRVYKFKKETPSLYAPPHERALQMLRTAYFKIDAGDFPELKARRELFLRSLGGRGIGTQEYTFIAEHDRLLADFDQRIGSTTKQRDREALYEERKKAIEGLTQKVMPLISRQDFERYMEKSKREPDERQAEQQRASDALRKFFGANDESRREILKQFPAIKEIYGEAVDPDSAAGINRWWDGYYALPPNSMERDDYVEANLPVLNALRAATGLPALTPRTRPAAPPIITSDDPFYQAILNGTIAPDTVGVQ